MGSSTALGADDGGQVGKVDISAFTSATCSDDERLQAGRELVAACHRHGFVKLTGHGVAVSEVADALQWARKLFDLPYAEKMKAPHPPTSIPHRGYSGIGQEKVYTQEEVAQHAAQGNIGGALRKISDFKESYEIGSEHDDQQPNIWLPEEVLPQFRSTMTALYERLAGVGKLILEAIGIGLGLDIKEQEALMALDNDHYCQLRLLHYPPISEAKLRREMLARLPAHTDWGTFSMLLQDDRGGLELRDPQTGHYLHASPEEGTIVLNIGDMLQRFTNDYFTSALHRVAVPHYEQVSKDGVPARHSIPYFVAPAPSHVVAPLRRFGENSKYKPVKFEDYGALISKYMYQASPSEV